ncbi:hypothetical protein C8R44DRAFT_982819 [Mycena epipterygia]|nr:hypothetical protein C8R44DRAFT_982819 [Mycena epipterygia]
MMMKFAFFGLTAAAALTAVAAASIPRAELSACGSAINSILSSLDPGFNCIAPGALNDIIALTNKNASFDVVTSTVDHWLTEMCGAGSCSNDTLSQISGNVSTPCGADLLNATDYSFLRETMCLKDSTANKFCVTEAITPEGAADISGSSPELTILGLFLSSSALGATCNECTKAQYQLSVKAGSSNFQPINDICGANFTATLNSTAVGITQAAVNSDFKVKSKNGAGTLAPTTGLFLLAASGFFALL